MTTIIFKVFDLTDDTLTLSFKNGGKDEYTGIDFAYSDGKVDKVDVVNGFVTVLSFFGKDKGNVVFKPHKYTGQCKLTTLIGEFFTDALKRKGFNAVY